MNRFLSSTLTFTFLFLGWQAVSFAQSCPADVADLTPGHWCEVSNSRMDVNDPNDDPATNPNFPNDANYTGNSGLAGAMVGWSGGAFDTSRGRLIVWGGGHRAYAGNDVHVFDVNTQQWERLTDPSTNINNARDNTYPDGEPRSRHTYSYIEYVPNIDRFISFGGSGPWMDGGGGFTRSLSEFNFSTNEWSYGRTEIPAGGSQIGTHALYDQNNGVVWYTSRLSGSFLHEYDPLQDVWTTHNTRGPALDVASALDYTRQKLVMVGSDGAAAAKYAYLYDLSAANISRTDITAQTTGNEYLEGVRSPGFQYDPVTDQFVGWGGGSSVYTLNPDTFEWQEVPATGGITPTNPNDKGTYGRFRYVPSKNVFILVNDVDENVFFYKLSSGGGIPNDPAATVELSANPSTIDSSDDVTLSWSSTNAATCTASGGWSGNKATSGSETVNNLTVSSTFTLQCDANGNGAGASDSVTVTVMGDNGGGDPDADWLLRSTEAGVLMSTNFDTEAEVTNWTSLDNTADHVVWDTNNKASGNGSLRFDILKTDAQSSGNWRRWLSDDQREFTTGDRFYVSYRQYVPAYLATHKFLEGGGWKQSIVSRRSQVMNGENQDPPTGSNQLNELVVQNNNHAGMIQGYNRDSFNKYPSWQVDFDSACSGNDFRYQNAIDRGVQNIGTPCENDRARYGGLYSYYEPSQNQQVDGQPDPLTGGFIYYPDEWLTIYLDIELGVFGNFSDDTKVKLYAAREGEDYQLLIDRDDIDLGDGPNHDTLWLLPYNTGREPDPTRQDTYTLYDEVIVSLNPIAAPNGLAPPVDDPLPTVDLVATPTSVASGETAVLTWSSSDATTCTASGGWSGSKATNNQAGETSVALNQDTMFILSCTGPGGSSSDTQTVLITDSSVLDPKVNLSISAGNINSGDSVTVSWAPENAEVCLASGDWFNVKNPAGGSETFNNITMNKSYSLTCRNSEMATAAETVNVTVAGLANPPTVDLNASPTSVASGESTLLSWSGTNITSCEASGDWSGVKDISGSETMANLTQSQSYILTCSGASGTAAEAVNVTITTSSSNDSDNDGLPDDWEMDNFGNLDQDASGDADNDGVSNVDEFNGGTNPTVANNSDEDSGGGNTSVWFLLLLSAAIGARRRKFLLRL